MQIALVDDDRGVRESLRFLLEIAGHQVDDYASAAELLDGCDLVRVGALILDQNMPDMTGLELASRLRADCRAFPIVLITAAPSPVVVMRATELNIDEVLAKPVAERDLSGLLARLSDGDAI